MKAQSRGASGSRRSTRSRNRYQRSFVDRYRGAIIAGVLTVFVGGLLLIAVLEATSSNQTAASSPSQPLDPALAKQLTSVSATIFDSVGAGSATNPPRPVNGTVLTEDGKPEVLYIGAEFCPFCAADRWPLVLALSRFGTFTGLKESHSAADDAYPNTPTVSFYGSTYTSDYLAFTAVETATNQRSGAGYEPLQSLTREQQDILNRYNSGGGIPFLYIAGQYMRGGASFNPSILAGKDVAQVIAALQNSDSTEAKAIAGSANVLTATFCRLTGGQPGDVCQAPGVVAASSQLR